MGKAGRSLLIPASSDRRAVGVLVQAALAGRHQVLEGDAEGVGKAAQPEGVEALDAAFRLLGDGCGGWDVAAVLVQAAKVTCPRPSCRGRGAGSRTCALPGLVRLLTATARRPCCGSVVRSVQHRPQRRLLLSAGRPGSR